ncbi:heavy metal-binding domain-containing protein [Aeromonas rivipollensis]
MVYAAKEKGANAVVNVRLISSSYRVQGSQWEVTYVVAYGDAVNAE